MNTITKQIIAEKFRKLCDASDLKLIGIAERMGFHPCNISGLRTEKYQKKIGPRVWEKMQKAVNSGDKIEDHLDKVYPENEVKSEDMEIKPKITGKDLITTIRRDKLTPFEKPTEIPDIQLRINISLLINGKEVKF